MISVNIDRSEPVALHDQVAGAIRKAIAEGEAKPGDRLPPARDLAAVLKVNSNTVLSALRELRDKGILEFRRGRGVTMAGGARSRSAVIAAIADLLCVAKHNGYRPDGVIALIEEMA